MLSVSPEQASTPHFIPMLLTRRAAQARDSAFALPTPFKPQETGGDTTEHVKVPEVRVHQHTRGLVTLLFQVFKLHEASR